MYCVKALEMVALDQNCWHFQSLSVCALFVAPSQTLAQSQAQSQATQEAQAKLQAELEEVRGRLQQAEKQISDLQERLQNASTNVEQYRTVVLSLEESLSKEKQVMC